MKWPLGGELFLMEMVLAYQRYEDKKRCCASTGVMKSDLDGAVYLQ